MSNHVFCKKEEKYHYSKTCVREPPCRLTLNSGWCGKSCLSYKGTCHVILLAKLHDMYLYKITAFPHQPLMSVSKVAVLHRFYCTLLSAEYVHRVVTVNLFIYFNIFYLLYVCFWLGSWMFVLYPCNMALGKRSVQVSCFLICPWKHVSYLLELKVLHSYNLGILYRTKKYWYFSYF